MSDYCSLWHLNINTDKTKVVVFWKSKKGINKIEPFYFEGNTLEVVDQFAYLGVKFSYNGKFTQTKQFLINQARKTMFSVISKARKLNLPVSIQIHLFNTMIEPILLYGCEAWGFESVDIIDRFQLQFYKIILKAKKSTPTCMLLGELGELPLSIKIIIL